MCKCKRNCRCFDDFGIEDSMIEGGKDEPDADGYLVRNVTTGQIMGYYACIDTAINALECCREDAALRQLQEFDDEA